MYEITKKVVRFMEGHILKNHDSIVADLPTEATTETSGRTGTPETTETYEKTEMTETSAMPETEKLDESSCQENEVFVECSRKCGRHCHIPVWDGCEFAGPCYPRCECKPGYARNQEDECVPEEECLSDLSTETTAQMSERNETPGTIAMHGKTEMTETSAMPETEKPIAIDESSCQENEVFVECSRKCGRHCHIPVWDGCEFAGPCYPRCECKPGYARNQEDECVPEEECLSVPCNDPNEVRKLQGLKDLCRPTCEYRNFTELCDEPMHLSFACECKPGYILDDIFGKCVPIGECKTADLSTETTAQMSERNETPGTIAMHGKTEMTEMSAMPETEKPIAIDESSCQENEVFVECSRKCGLHCHIPVWVGAGCFRKSASSQGLATPAANASQDMLVIKKINAFLKKNACQCGNFSKKNPYQANVYLRT
ncbi:trypsin Inhibitor like cysteine rich domain protein [Ancylostoma caninum]|uniref:Trypsin Inhibitor like cysteine rich domain protein n=1 Tax=Ancylostoma caninum TaxID=29170 RepID=A0A368H346_ANCCA|nr:trypsin Inhibitor like cysteine rich domain protein [Ancylostoma caninum]